MLHSKLTITVERDSHHGASEEHFNLEGLGCNDCMTRAITMLMVKDEKFRAMINTAGREANKIRRGEGGTPAVNPTNN